MSKEVLRVRLAETKFILDRQGRAQVTYETERKE